MIDLCMKNPPNTLEKIYVGTTSTTMSNSNNKKKTKTDIDEEPLK